MLNDKKKAMIRVVSRPFLGKEKFKDFRLCYVDAIPETVFGLTPESKAWQRSAEYRVIKKKLEEEVRQGIRNSIYGMDICQMLETKVRKWDRDTRWGESIRVFQTGGQD